MAINDADRLDLQVMVATLYYRQKMSQQEIGEKLNMSRPTVSRILRSCVDDGIVSIHIKNISSQQYELAQQIKKKYNLIHVGVVSEREDKEQYLSAIGSATADYLESCINQNTRIGISAGVTLSHLVEHLHPASTYGVDIYQLQGDASHQIETCSSLLSAAIAKELHAKAHVMHVPLLVNSKVLRDLLLEEPYNKKHFMELYDLDLAVVGLGIVESLLPSTSDNWGTFRQDKQMLESLNVTGDICGNFIDCDGRLCKADICDRTIAISLEQLQSCKNCIAVACGKEKKKILKAAIAGRLISSVVMDESLAVTLLED